MADSLLQALLAVSNSVSHAQFLALDEVKKRLLLSELYEALARDSEIMPLLVQVILQKNGNAQYLFDKLVSRIGENFAKIT
jgi:hypothetical protein